MLYLYDVCTFTVWVCINVYKLCLCVVQVIVWCAHDVCMIAALCDVQLRMFAVCVVGVCYCVCMCSYVVCKWYVYVMCKLSVRVVYVCVFVMYMCVWGVSDFGMTCVCVLKAWCVLIDMLYVVCIVVCMWKSEVWHGSCTILNACVWFVDTCYIGAVYVCVCWLYVVCVRMILYDLCGIPLICVVNVFCMWLYIVWKWCVWFVFELCTICVWFVWWVMR